MIEVTSLKFSYSTGTSIEFPDFFASSGEHLLLLGESGSGKTTLLHLLGGLLRKYQGSVRIDKTELASLSETALDRFRGQKAGFIFQRNHLISALTVEKNLMVAPYLAGLPVAGKRIDEVLLRLGLASKKKSKINELSQGQLQRVAIARAVLNKPSVLLADEPTSALDDSNCEKVIGLLLEVASENNSTLIIATHDQRLKEKFERKVVLTPAIV